MAKPAILAVDDDVAVSRAITRDLRSRYGGDYSIIRATSGAEALATMAELALRDRSVALVASDQRMPQMTGIELLEQVRLRTPDTKLLLLTAYADTDVAIKAINDIGLDYYLLKPWDPPADRLYPVIDDLLDDWSEDHPDDTATVRVVGHRWSDRSQELKTFLARNHVPYRWLDVERDEEAQRLLQLADGGPEDLPLVLVPDREALRTPTTLAVAEALGLRTRAEQPLYDLCIVGGGPAGLAAAVYAASEGLRTVVVERDAPGGQAGQSASIENYLGFPKGLTGADLTHRAVAQAARFGAEMVLARDVLGFESRGPVHAVRFDSGEIEARALLVATGVSYRRLDAEGLDALGLQGARYGATASEADECRGEEVYVVGAANSAGQAALNLARFAKRVVLVVRGESLTQTMSQYLVGRVLATENIEVLVRTEVVAARGDGHLEAITLADRANGTTAEVATSWLFVFIGAMPRTSWLGDAVARDDKGFVLTGPELVGADHAAGWPLARPPYALETSVPGVFAAGDVRLDSMKRVASAVGEGAMSVHLVHRYLATI
ncbi:FAD-dependent oxidoreductase [Nocardioides sp. JQ2195]|uniref:FAD-dependent oxidoreductase n=1 Tax=Nocardioides sp. JQ2195 TaxID=2592334 RepID=UPI00143ECB73|nr:FAD-dependent oxidoreductase [Nocardioides sp. JQ2195]QIX28441.1 FAD-dependent oxidoreductase [Nocardioides sp. JQ2195]